MIDNFSIGLTHGLIMLAAIILLFRRDLDKEAPPESTAETTPQETERRVRERKAESVPDPSNRVRHTWGSSPDA
jgi:hypothetical protein